MKKIASPKEAEDEEEYSIPTPMREIKVIFKPFSRKLIEREETSKCKINTTFLKS